MPQPPAQRSRRFLSENSPTPEAASEGDEEGGMPPRQPRLAWQETWSSRGSNRPAEDSLLAVDRTPVEAFLPSEDSRPAEDSLLAEDSTSVEDILPAEDRSPAEDSLLAEYRTPVEAFLPSEDSSPAEDSLLSEDSTSVEDILPSEDSSPAEDSLLSEDSTSVEDILPAEDSSPVEDRRPAEDIAQAAGSSQVEESQDDVQWLDPNKAWKLSADSAMEFIVKYISGTEKDDEEQKMLFLSKICDLCRTVTERGVLMNLRGFCCKHKLVENIMALLEKEPVDSLRTAFRQKAMETVALLSKTVPIVLHGKMERLLHVCCKSIFFLPPESDVPETEGALYTETMKAMDTMLEGFVLNCPIASFNIEMQNMLKVMLDFAGSKNSDVRESAVKVIERLITFFRWYLVIKILGNFENYGNDEPTDFNLHIPIHGKLLGHLLLFSSGDDSMSHSALGSLHRMYTVVREVRESSQTKGMKNYAERHKNLEDTAYPFSTTSTPCEIAKVMSSGLAGDLVRSISRHLV
eukprot:XP_027303297.1 uncharacterized protein LOC113840757 isoform X2 [Anas platyrhynchos]